MHKKYVSFTNKILYTYKDIAHTFKNKYTKTNCIFYTKK